MRPISWSPSMYGDSRLVTYTPARPHMAAMHNFFEVLAKSGFHVKQVNKIKQKRGGDKAFK